MLKFFAASSLAHSWKLRSRFCSCSSESPRTVVRVCIWLPHLRTRRCVIRIWIFSRRSPALTIRLKLWLDTLSIPGRFTALALGAVEEGERQKEVQEDKGDEEIGVEVNGEVEESHSTCAWDMAMTMRRTRHKLEPQCVQSCKQGTVQQTRTTLTTKTRQSTKQTTSGHPRVFS